MRKRIIRSIKKNIHGAWVISGVIGTQTYYYMTKEEAIGLYRTEADERRIVYNGTVMYIQ